MSNKVTVFGTRGAYTVYQGRATIARFTRKSDASRFANRLRHEVKAS